MFRPLLPLFAHSLLAVAFLSSCAVEDGNHTSSAESASRVIAPEPTQTVLATLQLSPTHSVRFLETSDGDREVVESLHADDDAGQPSLAALDTDRLTLGEIHRHLRPGVRVPDELVAADTRAAARVSAPLDPPLPADAFSVADALATIATEAVAEAVAATSFYWDWAADAAWFRQYFYTGGTGGYFGANAYWVHVTKYRMTSWYKASAFNQSFEGNAWFRVKRSYSCFPGTCSSTKLSEPVANRMVTTYLGTDTRVRQAWMDGYGVNPRVGLAVRWVMDGEGSGPSPWLCGGHAQLQCWTGNPCDPGLQPYNGACYGCGTVGQACCLNWGPTPTPGGWTGLCAQGYCGYPGGYCQ
jgi:hypothetical protein